MEEREDLYLRKQSKFYNRSDIEPMSVVSDIDKSNFVKLGGIILITKVKLQRFKKFKNNEIILKPFTVLMGENSCGKTTVI